MKKEMLKVGRTRGRSKLITVAIQSEKFGTVTSHNVTLQTKKKFAPSPFFPKSANAADPQKDENRVVAYGL